MASAEPAFDWTSTAKGMSTIAKILVTLMEAQERGYPKRPGHEKREAVLAQLTFHETGRAWEVEFASFLVDLLADASGTKPDALLRTLAQLKNSSCLAKCLALL